MFQGLEPILQVFAHYFYTVFGVGIYGQISTRDGEPRILGRPFEIMQ